MYTHADLTCRLPGLGAGPDSDLSWPLPLDAVQIGELLAIQGVFGPLAQLERYAVVRVHQPLLLETVLLSRLRRAPYFRVLVEKLQTDPRKRADWALQLTPLELVDPDDVDTQERIVPQLFDPVELGGPLFSVEEVEEFLSQLAEKEKKS